MREPGDVFHLAIAVDDLDKAIAFYRDGLGCKQARRYDDRVTFDFFGDQLVCHLSPMPTTDPACFPGHFGVTFRQAEDFDRLLRLVELRKLPVASDLGHRFAGTAEEHRTVMLHDPCGNLLEFKHYIDPRMIY